MKLSLNQKILRPLLFVFGLILFASPDAFACSCMSPGRPCEAFSKASAVFVGRAVSAAMQQEGKDEKGNKVIWLGGTIHFAVEKTYSGGIGKDVDIHSGTGGGDCGYFFEMGEVYVVYAYGNSKDGFSTGICTRTNRLRDAHEDLDYLQNLPKSGTPATLKGVVYQNVTYQGENQEPRYDGLAGIEISLTPSQGKEVKTVTDDEGKYEFKELKPGTYIVNAALPEMFKRGNNYSTNKLTITDRGCGVETVMFHAVFDGRITGVVFDANDQTIKKGAIVLLSADRKEKTVTFLEDGRDYIDDNGRFEFDSIRPGRYRIGINVNSNPDQDLPYPPVWYPGVPDESQATIIEVGPGQKFSDFVFKLPQKLTQRIVQGVVVWPNGKPAAKASIHIESEERPGWCVNGCNDADEQGRFTLIGYEGFKYFIHASAYINPEADYKDRKSLYAVPVPVELKEDASVLKIVLTLDEKAYEEQHKRKREQ